MVLSKINDKISYKELKKVNEDDINKESELYQIVVNDIDIIIALGNAKHIQNITYFPIYLVKQNDKVMQIGVYELKTSDLPKYINKETQLVDVELLDDALIYIFITKKMLEDSRKIPEQTIYEMTIAENEVIRLKRIEEKKQALEEGEDLELSDSDLDEDEKELRKEMLLEKATQLAKQNELGVVKIPEYRQHLFKLAKKALIMAPLPEETKQDALTIKEEFVSGHLWIQQFLKNNNYLIQDNEAAGDCFFAVIRDAFEQIGQQTTVPILRHALANDETDLAFINYRDIYFGAVTAYKEERKQTTHLAAEYEKYKTLIANTLNKAEQRELTIAAKKIKAQHDKIFLESNFSKKTLTDNKFMKGVENLQQFKAKIATSEYWADENAISRLERILNVKFILLSNENYKAGDVANVLNCGETDERIQSAGTFTPEYYIICDYSGVHYQLIKYKKKGIFTFSEIPYDIKKLIVHKCMERNSGGFSLIPEFKAFKNELSAVATTNARPDFHELSSAKLRGLYDDNIVFVFYNGSSGAKHPGKGAGEKIDSESLKEFAMLSSIPDWRRKLDNSWTGNPFQIDGHRWQSVDHYLAAISFKDKYPEFYLSFSLESGTPLSKDLELVKCAISSSGKCKGTRDEPGKLIRPKEVTVVPLSEERELVEMNHALLAKFEQNEDLKEMLMQTKNAALKHYKKSAEPTLEEPLMVLREKLKE